ncbi:hypothetical protein ACEPAH_1219 [Sanghuangporus vaninii]
MSKQELEGHDKGNNVPVSNRHRQEDQTRRKAAESEYSEARSGARHVQFETPKNHGDHSRGRRVRGEPRSTRGHHEDNRRRCGDFGSEPFQETYKNRNQMAKHTDREKPKEDFQRRAATRRLDHSNGIAKIPYDSDRLEEYEMMHEYEEKRRRKYLSATWHRTASGKKGQRPSLLQRFTPLLTIHKSNEWLPRKAIRLEIVQGKRKNEIQEETVMLRYAEVDRSRKEEWAQYASQLEDILATTTSQSARTK